MNVQKIAPIIRKGQKVFSQIFSLWICSSWLEEFSLDHQALKDTTKKPKKCFLDVRKKSEKVKILSKLFFQLPIWRQKSRFDIKAAKFPPQIRHFLAPSRKLFHKVNLMFLSKWFSGHVKFIFETFVEKFRQSWKTLYSNSILNWKKAFRKNNSTKSSRTFRMHLWQIWRNLFSELRFFFARTRS